MKKKVILADFVEYNDQSSRLGNYHYCNCFVEDGYEALWVSNNHNPLIYLKDKEDYRFKRSISGPERHELAPSIYGFSAFSARLYGNYPLSRNPKVVLHNERYIFPNVEKSLRKMSFLEVDTLWLSNPKLFWLTNVVKYKNLVYRIPDDFAHFKEYPDVELIEDQLIQKADQIFITATNLREKVERKGREPVLLSNGVSYEHFAKADSAKPPELRVERKRIIYVGAIKYWLDIVLIERLAKEVDADFYIIGKQELDLSTIKNLNNVHLLGARPYEKIPDYLHHCDVAIIPFIKSSLTDAVSPIKLYEYCSAGIAVVCSDMEEVKKANAPVYIAKDHEDFITGVKGYLDNGYDKEPLIAFGKENSWKHRYHLAQSLLK